MNTEVPSILVPTEDGPVVFLLGQQYDEFAQIYDARRELNPLVDDLNAMEDDRKTTVGEYERVCFQRLMELKEADLDAAALSLQELRYWEWERNTWNLIQKLFPLRYLASPDETTRPHAYSSDVAHLIARTSSSPKLQEALLVKAWLEDVVEDFTPVEVRRGYLPYTARRLDHKRPSESLVMHMDPDAPTRTHKTWDSNDQDYENQLMMTLFNFVRRGMMTDAVQLCKLVDEPWRAASLLGGLLKSDGVMDSDETWNGKETYSGNSNRGLWKAVCRKICRDETAVPHERALYAVLSGEWKQALEVCNSWEDELWTMYTALVEEMTEAGLHAIPHAFPEHGPISNEETMETLNPMAIFEQLDRSTNKQVRRACTSPFHIIQKMIVLNRVGELVSQVRQELEQARNQPDQFSPFRHPHVLRFMVHLVLSLRPLNQQISEQDGNYIIKCYVDALVDCKKSAIVAPYAAVLPVGDRTDSYSSLLSNINPNANAKRDYLSKARNYGMDTSSIAWQAVEKAFNRGIRSEPLLDPKQVRLDWNTIVSPADQSQIRSLEWLTMIPDQLDSALFATNFLMRRLMLHGRISAARDIQRHLPPDFVPAIELEKAIDGETGEDAREQARLMLVKEHLGLLSILNALETYHEWIDVLRTRPIASSHTVMPRTSQRAHEADLSAWKAKMAKVTDKAVAALEGVLKARWITTEIDELQGPGDVSQELNMLKDVYLPEIVFSLQHVLYDSRDVISANLQRSIDLAQDVADEENGIYRVMQRVGRLQDLLCKIRVASLALISTGESDPFGPRNSVIMETD